MPSFDPAAPPVVSCVIPAYENPALFSRCVLSALTQTGVALEVVVSDDSASTDILDFCALLAPRFPNLRRITGARTGNPVDNWNHGLEAARGRYCVLIHHDEFLVDPSYLQRAAAQLDGGTAVAVIARSAVIGVSRTSRAETVRRLARRLSPPLWMLNAFNWIGSTACVVFRADPARRFDRGLQWFVDVDFYTRLLRQGVETVAPDRVAVGSIGHHDGQISSRIDIAETAERELEAMTADGRLTPFQAWAIRATIKPRRLVPRRRKPAA